LPRHVPAKGTIATADDPAPADIPSGWAWLACAFLLLACAASGNAAAAGDAGRGQYVAIAGGCVGCHTEDRKDAPPFAGGHALKTSYGTFYGPNLTPHPQAGLGRWSEADFVRAMRVGVRPDGAHYYPAFPYPSFTRISDGDLADLWAYLRSLPPNSRPNQAQELRFPFRWRYAIAAWKWLFFTPGPPVSDTRRTALLDRGAYLVEALGHCGECHTPRNLLGAVNKDRPFAGGKSPTGKDVPNLTPTRLKKWSDAELREFLVTGITPEFDSADEAMAVVVRNTTSRLTPADLAAMIAYLRAMPPLPEASR
jgi:mono/diheme cytochrome c family protein